MLVKALAICTLSALAFAHFQTIILSSDVATNESKTISLKYEFTHPFEQNPMEMAKPIKAGVSVGGKIEEMSLEEGSIEGKKSFSAEYTCKKPGDHIFFIEPTPYFEPEEEKFIKHLTKTTVNAFGMEESWDKPIGLKAEIVPLTRPYGVWAGNVFTGVVLFKGKPVANAEIEVEFYNGDKSIKAPTDAHITQVVKSDKNGVFSYAMPKAGYWGFAALLEDDKKLKHTDGKEYPVELGAVFWLETYEMK